MKNLANSTALFIANAITSVAYYAMIILIARRLGATEFGNYSFAIAYAGLFVTVANFGLDRILIREISRDRESAAKYLATTAVLRICLAVLALLLASVSAEMVGYPVEMQVLIIVFGLSLVINLFSETFRSVFYAFEAMPSETMVRLIGRGIVTVSVILALASGMSLIGVGWAIAASSFCELFVYSIVAVKSFRLRHLRFDIHICWNMLRESLPLAVNTLLVVIYFRMNVVILTTLKGAQAAGWFGAALTFVQLLQLVSGTVVGVALPVMSRQYTQSSSRMLGSLNKAIYYLLILVFPLVVGTYFAAPHLVDLIYGAQYSQSIAALQIVAWSSIFMFMGSIFNTALIALNKQGWLMLIALAAAIFNVLLNLLLIPFGGHIGTSVATVVTEALVAVLAYGLTVKYLKGTAIRRLFIKPMVAAGIMGLTMYALRDINWILGGVLAVIVYTVMLVVIRGVPQEDQRKLMNYLKTRQKVHDAI